MTVVCFFCCRRDDADSILAFAFLRLETPVWSVPGPFPPRPGHCQSGACSWFPGRAGTFAGSTSVSPATAVVTASSGGRWGNRVRACPPASGSGWGPHGTPRCASHEQMWRDADVNSPARILIDPARRPDWQPGTTSSPRIRSERNQRRRRVPRPATSAPPRTRGRVRDTGRAAPAA